MLATTCERWLGSVGVGLEASSRSGSTDSCRMVRLKVEVEQRLWHELHTMCRAEEGERQRDLGRRQQWHGLGRRQRRRAAWIWARLRKKRSLAARTGCGGASVQCLGGRGKRREGSKPRLIPC
jgi:hypothetical protein